MVASWYTTYLVFLRRELGRSVFFFKTLEYQMFNNAMYRILLCGVRCITGVCFLYDNEFDEVELHEILYTP